MNDAGEGIESTIVHTWPFPPWVTVLGLLLATLFVAAIYARERSGGRLTKIGLATLRLGLIGLVVFMMYGWLRHRHKTDLPDVAVYLDDSASMALVDQYDSDIADGMRRRVRAAGFDDLTRLNLAKTLLLEQDARLLKSLEQRYHLKLFVVGAASRQLGGEPADKTLAELLRGQDAVEPASRLGAGLRHILETQRGRPTAAVVLFTDGITTDGKTLGEVADYARRKNVPLFVIGLGNDKPPRDVRLSDLLVDDAAYVGDLLNFDFKLSGSGYSGKEVTVRLKRKDSGGTLAEKTFRLGKDGGSQAGRLTYRPREKGEVDFVLEAQRLDGEADIKNNRLERRVSIREETIRVLFVQEYPNFEFRYLKSLLGRGLKRGGDQLERAIELKTVLQEADLDYAAQDETALRVFPVRRDELFAFDVLLFGDVNPSYLSPSVMQNISEFVTERGGGLIFLAGPRHTPAAYRDTPLAKLLPIDPATVMLPDPAQPLDKPINVKITQLGLASPHLLLDDTPAASLRVWQNLPPLYWMLDAPDLRPGARVLVEHPTRTGNTGQLLPLVAMQFVGAGKVVFHATDETSRWSRYPQAPHGKYLERYWMQTIRFLSRAKLLGTNRAAELSSDREEYRRGESVRLRLRFLDERQAPAQDDGVTIVVEREGSQRRQFALHRDATNRGIFEGTISNLAEGNYRAWVAQPALEGQPTGQNFAVVTPPGELARLEMDAADLQLAAKISQGKFYSFKTADRLLSDLPRGRQVRIESLPSVPLWNSPWLAGAFVAMIVAEWLLRKRAGML